MDEPIFQFHLSTIVSISVAIGFLCLGLFGNPVTLMRKNPPGNANDSGQVMAFVFEGGLPFRSYRCIHYSWYSNNREKDADSQGMTEITNAEYLYERDKNFDEDGFVERWLLSGLALNSLSCLTVIGIWTFLCKQFRSRSCRHTAMSAAT